MKQPACEWVRDLLPDLTRGAVTAGEAERVKDHLGACPGCRQELEVLEALRGAAPKTPGDLASRIQAKVREEFGGEVGTLADEVPKETGWVLPMTPRRRRVPMWALSAAAVLVLALGTSVLWKGSVPEGGMDPVDVAFLEPLPESWLWDDGMVAGAPVFDGLSDEELEALLKEFEG